MKRDPSALPHETAPPAAVPRLAARPRDAHKGTFGRLLIIGASPGLTGAVALAAQSALRAGAGLVTCAVPASANAIIETKCTEPMSLALPETNDGHLHLDALASLEDALQSAAAVVVGPGLGRSAATTEFLQQLLPQLQQPHLVDADGLWHLAQLRNVLVAGHKQRILTPHEGEWQRLATTASPTDASSGGTPVAEGDFVTEVPGVLVRKGPGTRVLARDRCFINSTGNPGLATGGTGDVLAGIIGAFVARGDTPWNSAVRGVWVHGRAGDIAANHVGEESLIASDVVAALPTAMQHVATQPE
ncbi:MAG: NAD(P)H-hydrate dehydratase [Planctomycetota bacterium]